MSQLFNNKYYNQLFGGKKEEEQQQKKRQQKSQQKSQQKKQRQQKSEQKQEQDDSSMSTEDTRQRLERIFGGAKGKKSSAKPKVAAARKTDAQVLAEGKVKDAGKKNGKQVFEFKNGAQAVRDASGRFVIVKGASKATMAALRGRRTGPKAQRISADQAKKAFGAYWNRKMREAASHDNKHGLKGRKSHKAAVKRSKTYHMKYAHKNPARHLSPESDKGYLYLRKERVIRGANGMPSRKKDGSVRVRRAGPAIYDFIGVAPEVLQHSKHTGSKARIAAARAARKTSSAPKLRRARATSVKGAVAARDATMAALKAARMASRPQAVRRSASKKAMKAKAPKSASKKVRKTRSNAGKVRGPRKSASAHKSAKKAAAKAVSASKKVRKTRSNAGKVRGPRKSASARKSAKKSTSSRKSAKKSSSSRKSAKKSSSKKVRKTRSNAGKTRGARKGKATATVEELSL
jgi:hypothetical protein